MIWSLFSLFIFLVITGEEVVEPEDSHAPLGISVEVSSEDRHSTQPEEDCRYHDGPIPQRDLSDYVVDSDIEHEAIVKKEVGDVENETSPEAEELQVDEVELEPKSPNNEEIDQ